jgi:hypothetical protein
MYFIEGQNGPFWMKLAQQAKKEHDWQLGAAKTRNKAKFELLKDPQQPGYNTTEH